VPGNAVLDEAFQERIGGLEVADFGVAQERAEAVLQMSEAAFDFAFGLRIGSDPAIDAQAGEGSWKLAARLGFGCCAGAAEEAERIGINAGGQTGALEGGAEVSEVSPRGVGGDEERAHEFARRVVFGENERLALAPALPLMNGAVVLPEFADPGALPAAAPAGGRARDFAALPLHGASASLRRRYAPAPQKRGSPLQHNAIHF
jgi:hypothetical protein